MPNDSDQAATSQNAGPSGETSDDDALPSDDDALPSEDAGTSSPADPSDATAAFDAGASSASTWSTPSRLEVAMASSSWSLVRQDAEGNALVVWLEWEDASDPIYSIKSLEHLAGAGWGKTQTVISNDLFIDPPCMKGNPTGSAVAAWAPGELGSSTVWGRDVLRRHVE